MTSRKAGREKRIIPNKTKRGNIPVPERLRALDRQEGQAVLATDARGQPYTSLVSFALLPDLTGAVFATPRATFKYRNIRENPQVALFIDNRSKRDEDLLQAEAVTLVGTARPVRRGNKWKALARTLMEKHPSLSAFIRSPTSALVLIEVSRCFHVSQFQTVTQWQVK